jgi:hypothetical protein
MTTNSDASFGKAVPGSVPNQRKCMTNQAVATAAASIEKPAEQMLEMQLRLASVSPTRGAQVR